MKQQLRQKQIVLLAIGLTLVVILSLYTGRGWLRGPAISWLTTQIYAGQIDRVFARDIEPINARLQPFGVTFKENAHPIKGGAKCVDGNFHYFRETIYCGQSISTVGYVISSKLADSWPQESKYIKTFLSEHGWEIDKHYQDEIGIDDLSLILDGSRSFSRIEYHKQIGKVQCSIGFLYQQAWAQLDIDEQCSRLVHIFGGYRL